MLSYFSPKRTLPFILLLKSLSSLKPIYQPCEARSTSLSTLLPAQRQWDDWLIRVTVLSRPHQTKEKQCLPRVSFAAPQSKSCWVLQKLRAAPRLGRDTLTLLLKLKLKGIRIYPIVFDSVWPVSSLIWILGIKTRVPCIFGNGLLNALKWATAF